MHHHNSSRRPVSPTNGHWESLNPIQSRFDCHWYEKLTANGCVTKKNSLPGNGPCPALGLSGCRVKKCRPATCSTQVCEKMLYVLNQSGTVACKTSSPLQIEELIGVTDIMFELCGIKNRREITASDVREYKDAVARLRTRLASVQNGNRQTLIEQALEKYLRKGV